LYFETLSRKDFLRDKAGEASRDCDGDERERKEGCAKEIAGSEFRIVFLCDGTDKSPASREVRGRQKMAIIKDARGLMAAIARLRFTSPSGRAVCWRSWCTADEGARCCIVP
jgi:hypothetical protein